MSEVEFNHVEFGRLVEGFGGQAEFARATGVSRQYINNLITAVGRSSPVPSVDRLAQFAQILGVDINALLIIPKELARKNGIAGVPAAS